MGELIIEVPSADDALLKLYECQSFSDFNYWSFHLYLYNEETLTALLYKVGFKVNWIKQVQRYPLSNHLYWLTKGLPGGQNIWKIFNNTSLLGEYQKVLESEKMCDTIICSASIM